MSDRKKTSNQTSDKFSTFDSFQNVLSQLGHGTANQNSASNYAFNPISRVRQQLEWAYRGSWIAGRVVDVVANDMTREGAEVISDDEPDKLSELDKEISNLHIWKGLCDTVKWARLYGGATALLMIDGQDPATPLRLDTIRKGQFRGLLPMDRWVTLPSLQDLVEEYGPNFGKPKYYDTVPDTGGMPRMKIHYSRVVRIEGTQLPYWQALQENLWGQSVLERMWDRLIAYDSTTTGVAQLVYKAHLRVLKVPGLRTMLASNQAATKGLMQQVNFIRSMQTNEGLTLLDGDDEFEAHAYGFGGLDAILAQFGEQLAGAVEIPIVRLFGQSPAGFSTGDADIRAYYDSVKQWQEHHLAAGVDKIYRLTYISKFGVEPPEAFEVKFKPLWQMGDIEKAQVTNTYTAAIIAALDSQAIDRATAMQELKALSRITGAFSNIQDDDIELAKQDPAPSAEMLGLVPPPTPELGGEGSKPTKSSGDTQSKSGQGRETPGAKAPAESGSSGAKLRSVAK